jgi:hypothetical protein
MPALMPGSTTDGPGDRPGMKWAPTADNGAAVLEAMSLVLTPNP